jgi:glyoxylase-like metal-dependent hydrolase (beta-lactamase superfamily II)
MDAAAMILKQFYLNCLAHASYLIGDEGTHTAAVVDPQRDIEQYLAFAAAHGLRIAHVVLTHFHADFIAGHLELRDRTGRRSISAPRPRPNIRSRRSATATCSNSDACG